MLSNIPHTHFNKQLGSGPSPKSCFYFKIPKLKVAYCLLSTLTKKTKFVCIPVIFQHSSLTYCLQQSKIKTVFMKFVAQLSALNINAFNRVNRKQFNILKTLLEYQGKLYSCLLRMIRHLKLLNKLRSQAQQLVSLLLIKTKNELSLRKPILQKSIKIL